VQSALTAMLIAIAGCDATLGLDHVEREPRYCTEPAQRDSTFCADFDQRAGDPFAGFTLADTNMGGEAYFIDTATVRSTPNAAALVITGPGSPDARLTLSIAEVNRFSGTLWLHLAPTEMNSVVLVRFLFGQDATQTSVFLRSDGRVQETRSMTNRLLSRLSPAPHATWFEVAFSIDTTDAAAATIELSVDQEATSATFFADPGMRRIHLGPAEPFPENQNAGWRVTCDDVVVRVES
jgi:hypothetical protein